MSSSRPPGAGVPAVDELRAAVAACGPQLSAAAAFSGAVNLLYLASPLYLMQIYNRVLVSGSGATLVMLTLILLIALVVMAVLDAIRSRLLVRVALRLDRLLAPRLMQAMLDRAVKSGTAGRDVQVLRDFDAFRASLAGPGMLFLFDAPFVPIYLALLFLIHPALGATATLGALILLGLAALNERMTHARLARSADAAARSYAFSESLMRTAEAIRAMGMAGGVTRRWSAERGAVLTEQWQASEVHANNAALTRFARLVLQAAMLAFGAWLAIDHAILPATIFAASIVMGRALAPVEQAVGAWRQLTEAGDAVWRVRAALASAPPEPPRTRAFPEPFALGAERVSHLAPGGSRPILRDLTFELRPAEIVALIGPSGAGKSTLVRLMVGITAPSAGKMRLGGLDLAAYDRAELGRRIGYLPQEVALLPGTIRDNIARFGKADEADIIAAARQARVHDLIAALPQGYDTPLGEGGAGLSGGQRQRIALARALIGRPRLIVLDEPNANLDAEGERALSAALEAARADGACVVIVSHRPAVIAQADRLMVIDSGRLGALGPRQDMIERLRRQTVRSVAASGRPA